VAVFVVRKKAGDHFVDKSSRVQKWQMFSDTDRRGIIECNKISATALREQKTGTTMFISGDGAGSIPTGFLQRHLADGGQVIVVYDADTAGEEMARKVIEVLPGATRIQPTYGKDCNEQLLIHHEAREIAQAVRQLLKHVIIAFLSLVRYSNNNE
jgi:5S rRNA maturation endonuclease (ribonuclease M5)